MSDLKDWLGTGGFEASDVSRTTALALLQLVPLAGGSIAQVIGDAWTTAAAKRIQSVVGFMAEELDRLRVDLEFVRKRIEEWEEAEVFFWEGIRSAPTTVSDSQRRELGNLLARGLSSGEIQVADSRSLLKRWQTMDDVERVMFLEVARAAAERRGPSMSVLGDQYFQGATHGQRMLREDFHRRRMQRLMDIGLIRPANKEAWDAGKYPWRIDHFWPSKIGELLYNLIAVSPNADYTNV